MKAAVLGAGGMGLTVLKQLKDAKQLETTIAYDIRADRIEELKGMGYEGTTDLKSILDDKDVRVCFVTSSNDTHYELVMQSLDAGKAVMCEKPIATTLKEANAMVEKAEQLDGFLQIGFELRYSKLYTKIKEWIDAGLLGEVKHVNCTYIASVWPKSGWRVKKEHCGNMFIEKLSHYVDIPRWWEGTNVVDVTSFCAPNTVPYYEVRDNYETTWRYASGSVGHLTFMMGPAAHFDGDALQNVVSQQTGDGHELRYKVVGTRGAAETDVFAREIKRWEFHDAPDYMECKWVDTLTWDESEDHAYFHNTHDQGLDIVRRVHEGEKPMTPARDALTTMRMSFAADVSADEGRTVPLAEIVPDNF